MISRSTPSRMDSRMCEFRQVSCSEDRQLKVNSKANIESNSDI